MHNTAGDIPNRKTVMKQKSVITLIAALVVTLTLSLAGCDDKNVSFPPDTQQRLKVSYELPDGWLWDDKDNLVAIWYHNSKVGDNSFVKLEPAIQAGTESSAKGEINNYYNEWRQECSHAGSDCLAVPEYKEMKIAGVTLYMAMQKSEVEAPGPYWSTTFAFVKDGYEFSAILYDRADLYNTELTKIISTLKITK